MSVLIRGVFWLALVGIGSAALAGLLTRNLSVVVNGVASVAASFTPRFVEYWFSLGFGGDVAFAPELPAWIAVAGFLHMLGMLGWYDSVSWWDHVTHTVSAALVAALVYTGVHTYDSHALGSQLSDVYVAVFTVLFTLAVGVFWEFIELAARELGEYVGEPPILEYYGLRDTILDTAFNGVGAVAVVALDVRVSVTVTDRLPRIIGRSILWGTVLLLFGTVALGTLLARLAPVVRDTEPDPVERS